MDEKVENGLTHREEEMEVTETTKPAGFTVASDSANAQTKSEEKGAVCTDFAAPLLPLTSACKAVDCDDKDSEDSDSDSSSSSSSPSSSSSSSSSPSAAIFDNDDDDEGFSQPAPIKTRDEVLLEELPAVENVYISIPEDAELKPVGTVSSIIQQLVIIQSLRDTPPLTDDSIIFTSDRRSVGKVFEVFGPVTNPLYILRLSSVEQISSKGLTEGMTVYYAPTIKECTGYILTQQLRLLKGSDASWKNDQEPPEEALDYSDDEKEQEAKRKGKNSKNRRDKNNTDNPVRVIQNTQQQHDAWGFSQRYSGPSLRQQSPRNKLATVRQTHPPPRQTHMPPMNLPPICTYPLPPQHHFPPPSFPLFPPPPSFFNPSFSAPLWPPNSFPFSDLPPPPPPPPPPQ